jgi:hypothetical protein
MGLIGRYPFRSVSSSFIQGVIFRARYADSGFFPDDDPEETIIGDPTGASGDLIVYIVSGGPLGPRRRGYWYAMPSISEAVACYTPFKRGARGAHYNGKVKKTYDYFRRDG